MLENESIPAAEKEGIQDIISDSLKKEYPDGIKAVHDCNNFMNRSLSGDTGSRTADALGCWIVWNLYGRKELNYDERQIIRVLGGAAIESFKSWWK
jgi:hypothetical protein